MIDDIRKSPLYTIVNPKSIAFFGASNNFGAMGSTCFASMKNLGFEGAVYPVHPKETEVQGYPAYASVLDLPETPDLAVLVMPTRLVCKTLEQCGRKGIRHAIVVSGGFREVGGDGVALEKELIQVTERYGIRFLGPNCIGVANPHHKLNTTFLHYEGSAGHIGIASQSGSFVTQMFNYLARFQQGYSTAFSIGNGANIDLVDCLEYLGACPNTKVIALYVEGIHRGRDFVETARRVALKKPIVALYVGGSETGRKAGFSHTGSMAGPDRLYDGIFRQCGIIRATSVTELYDYCRVLGALPESGGRRTIIQTHSGGPGAAAADALGREGLELAEISKKTSEKLKELMPHTGSIGNPVDITFSKNPLDFFSAIPKILLQEENADMLLVYFLISVEMATRPLKAMGMDETEALAQAEKLMKDLGESFARLQRECGKPVVGFSFRDLSEPVFQALMAEGIPVFSDPKRAARALSALSRYPRLREKIRAAETAN